MPRHLRIGIDVGSRVVKVVWTTSSRSGNPVWHAHEQPRRRSDTTDHLSLTLRAALHPLYRLRYEVPIFVAVSESHIRYVTLQVSTVRQIPQALHAAIPRLFPFEAARCYYQSQLMRQEPVNGQLACALQVAACDVDGLRQTLATFWRIGWIPTQVAPSALALVALAKAQGQIQDEPVMVMDLGASRSILVMVAHGQIVVAREVACGSEALTEALMSQVSVDQGSLQLSWEEAEELKCRTGLVAPTTSPDALEGRLPMATYSAMVQPVLEQWVGEIQRTIAFTAGDQLEAVPKKLLLCGGGAQLRGLDQWLAQQLGLTVQPLTVESLLGEARPACAVACGLLLVDGASRLNLLPEAAGRARRVIRVARTMITGFLAVSLAIWLAVATLRWQQRRLQRELIPLAQRWRALEPLTSLASTLVAYAALVNTIAEEQRAFVGWFGRLAEGFPNPIRLTDLTVGANRSVHMTGQAQTREQVPEAYVSEFATWLTQRALCDAVHLDASERRAQDPEQVEFGLTCSRP